METIVIKGGRPLFGSVGISGSKNAALPIIFAALTARGVSRINRLPDIGDTRVAIDIIREMGAKVRRIGCAVYVDTSHISYTDPSPDSICRIRASTYLLGACLAAFGQCRIGDTGGCNFSYRPIDMHIEACKAFGGEISGDRITAPKLRGCRLHFRKPSVGATINALIMAASAEGETVITGHAKEPHVTSLADFLISAGADITFTEDEIRVVGRELHGGDITVIPDMIEAGTYITAGLLTGGRVAARGCSPSELSSYLEFLDSLGASLTVTESSVTASLDRPPKYTRITAEPYPAFPTDLQPIAAPLLSISGGEIRDKVWQARYGYLSALSPFGLKYEVNGEGASIAPSVIKRAHTSAPDLRGGMAAVLLALMAEGESRVEHAEIIFRGYERPIEKLLSLGADTARITE